MLNNERIKELSYQNHIPQWKIAEAMGVTEVTVNRWLRRELSEERYQALLVAIDKLSRKEKNNDL